MDRDRAIRSAQLRTMNIRQRIQYILDYYLLYIIASLAAVAVVVGVVYHFTHQARVTFTAMMVTDQEPSGQLVADMNAVLLPGKGETADYIFVQGDSPYSQMVVLTHFAAGEPDIFIAEEDIFESAAESGMLCDLSEGVPENILDSQQDQLFRCARIERDENGNEISRGKDITCGMALPADRLAERYGIVMDNPYIGIAAGCDIKDIAGKMVVMLLQQE